MKRPIISKTSYAPMIFALIAIGILVGGFIYFSNNHTQESEQVITSQHATPPVLEPVSNAETPKEEPVVIDKKATEEKNKEFEIVVEYPVIKKGDAEFEAVNASIKTFVDATVKQFKADYNNAKNEDVITHPSTPWSLDMDYAATYQSENLISLVFSVSVYAGGAHPNGSIKTLVIDVKNQNILLLDNVLVSDTSLKTLSALVIDDLKKSDIADDEWIENGAAPIEENYEAWHLSDKGMTVLFPAYQVAAYVMGPQEVTIPFEKLKEVVKADYFIAQ